MVSNKIYHRLCSPNRFEKWLLSAGCYGGIWVVWWQARWSKGSWPRGWFPVQALLSLHLELASNEIMLTRMYVIWGSVCGSSEMTAGRESCWQETNVESHSKGLARVPGLDPLIVSMGTLQTSDFCWPGGAPQVPLPLSASWWVTSVCSWPQSRNSRSSTPPPMRPMWTQWPWRQKGCMCLRHWPA